MTRSNEDVLAGILRIPVGGVEKQIPTLPIKASREWQSLLADKLGGFGMALASDQSLASISAFASLSLDTILDLVVAYDRTGALGGREWLEENADAAQLYAALRSMGEVAFPFVNDVRSLLAMLPGLLAQAAVGSNSPSSTNGRSPTGASTRKPSKTDSTPRS